MSSDAERVSLIVDEPPSQIRVGAGVHGVQGLRDVFRLPDLWQFHLYGYVADLTVGGRRYPVRPGFVSLIPPGVQAQFDYTGRSEHLYVHFRTPAHGAAVRVPVVQDAGPAAAGLSDLLRSALRAAPAAGPRATAEVWTALWRVAQLPSSTEGHPRPAPGERHPVVGAAIAHIEANLAQPLAVPEVARAVGLSHNHLTRLFRAGTGMSVVGYIRQRRLAAAQHLLTATTMSIPAVAASIGIPDLQAFNKACRRELGGSPRSIRTGR